MQKRIEQVAIVSTLVLVLVLGTISIKYLREYGWTVFVLIPVLLGFLPTYITSKVKIISRKQSDKLAFITLGWSFLGLLVFAIEGIICIAMASPIAILLTWLGSYIAYSLQRTKSANTTNTILVLLASSIGFMSFDGLNEPKGLIPVRTKITVNSNINNVWNNVVTFPKIEEPTDWIFKTGISYPTDATIVGEGVGAIRYCNFTTGSFVEPITTWDEPNLLQFDVKEQPTPMNELNPFWDVHPPHLDGYFRSYKGQFKLTEIAHNITELEGTTWYQVDITPEIYWRLWSDAIIHRIHERVLNHIKAESEGI